MIKRMDTVGAFSETDNLDQETRKINTESANQELVQRPRLSFNLLIKLGSLAVYLVFFLVAIGSMVSSGQMHWKWLVLLIVFFILSGCYCFFLSNRLKLRIGHLIECVHRIAKGDFSPIFPKAKNRDEFTDVDVAVNAMLDELNTYHNQWTVKGYCWCFFSNIAFLTDFC